MVRLSVRVRRVALMTAGVLVAAGLGVTPPAWGGTAVPGGTVGATDLTGMIRLDICSASLARFPSSLPGDRALMLTNGHCFEGGFLAADEVITNRPSTRSGRLLNSAGSTVATVTADLLLYATMTGTDVALYRLTSTYAAIQAATGISARTISADHPVAGDTAVPSGFFKRVFDCDIEAFVPTLREDVWVWNDSIRYGPGCATVHGTSGSPIIDVGSGEIVGINNTMNENGELCTLDNPCEVGPDGGVTVTQGARYGQQTYWLTTCLTTDRRFDLDQPGCLLIKPGR
jgi:hypothetical protein